MISAALAIIDNESQRNELSEIYERNYLIAFSRLHILIYCIKLYAYRRKDKKGGKIWQESYTVQER